VEEAPGEEAPVEEAPVAEPFVHRMRIRYGECDPQGVVFNAHYLAYVDDTISALWRATFGSYQVMLDRGVDIVVAEAHLRFLDAARFDEDIEIETAVTHLGTTSMRTLYRFLRDGKLLLTASLRHVFVQEGSSSKTPIPDWARAGLEQWLLPELDPAATA
jgi:acyl-CoA thioester hydrolase